MNNRVQYVAIIFSLILLFLVIELVRRKRILEKYSILWLFFSFLLVFFSVWRHGLDILSNALGIAYPPAAIFLVLIMALFCILIQFSIAISKLTESNKTLTQEMGILKMELEKKRLNN